MAEAKVKPAGPAPTIKISDKTVETGFEVKDGLAVVAISRLANIAFILRDDSVLNGDIVQFRST